MSVFNQVNHISKFKYAIIIYKNMFIHVWEYDEENDYLTLQY